MTKPGVDVTLLDTPGTTSVPTDTGTLFATGLTDRGPVVATLIQSLDEFATVFGPRVSYSVLYDYMETFFREGGNRTYIGRVVGPSATSGFKNLVDNVAAVSLIATGIGPGAWSATYKVAVVAGSVGGTFVIQVTDASNNVLEDSGNLADQASAVNWSKGSKYIRITLGASALVPIVAAAAVLSAGTDDRASITDTQWLAAQDLFVNTLGPGQVTQPGRVTSTAYGQLTAHTATHNRVALLDGPDTPSESTLVAAFSTIRSRFAAPFAPWLRIPGLVSGTTRTVPPTALIAGLIARNDRPLGPNHAAAGINGIARFVTDLSEPNWTDVERQAANLLGVNIIRRMFAGIRVYGWRSLADPINDSNWIDFGNARLFMALSAELSNAGENFMFEDIDGQNGSTIGAFHEALAGVLMKHYNNGELFGDTADQSFSVDTSPAVNTLATIQALELHAVCRVKMSQFAEYIPIQIVKLAITEAV